jgi:DNA-directed RNA polymerase specialized sigma24 family protein
MEVSEQNLPEPELLEAIRRLKSGVRTDEASEFLVKKFRARLQSYFTNHRFNPQDAEDLVQDTFRRVFTGIGGLREESRFLGWLFQIARNVRFTAQVGLRQTEELVGSSVDMAETVVVDSAAESPLDAAISNERLRRTWAAKTTAAAEAVPGPEGQPRYEL